MFINLLLSNTVFVQLICLLVYDVIFFPYMLFKGNNFS